MHIIMQQQGSSIVIALLYAVVAFSSPHGGPSTQGYRMHLTRDPTFGFLGNVSVGSPPQTITSFVDWTWISLYVVTDVCDGQSGNPLRCLSPQQHYFNELTSSTFESQHSLYPSRTWNPNEFFGSIDFTVDYASDVVAIGPSTSRITLQTSDLLPGIFTSTVFPFTGIFGLSPVFSTDNGMSSYHKLSVRCLA